MLTQGFSQALQILKDTCLEANEVVLQPGLAGSLHMYSLSLKLPMPLNKPKKQSKEDQSKKTEQNLFFLKSKKSFNNYVLYSEELQGRAHQRKFTYKEWNMVLHPLQNIYFDFTSTWKIKDHKGKIGQCMNFQINIFLNYLFSR